MDNKQLGSRIVELVGGEGNINSLVHCATRLRFKLKDTKKADKQALSEIADVLTVVEKGGQFQVVIGNKVGKVYTEIMNHHHISAGEGGEDKNEQNKSGVVSKVFEYISGTFSPLIPALAGAGMIKALLALLSTFHWIDTAGNTYAVLNAASSGVFYFLPILVGITAAKKLGANLFVGGAIAASLLEPNFTALLSAEGSTSFMHIPLIVVDYSSTVFPILIAMALYAPLERFLKKYTPDMIQLFFVPMVSLLVMVPLTALVFGPFSDYLSAGLGSGVIFLLDKSAILTGIIIASIWPVLVILGVHWGVVPIMISNFSRGGDMIGPITAASTFAQMGIAFGIFLRYRKDKNLGSLSLASTLSGLLAGVTEPIIYGIILKYKRLLPLLFISGAVGGAIVAIFKIKVFTFVFNSILTIPAYTPSIGYAIGIGAAFFLAAALAFIVGKDGKKKEEDTVEEMQDNHSTVPAAKGKIEISSPLVGEMIALDSIEDPVFSSGAMGKGMAIEPTIGLVVAPFDAKVSTLLSSNHAIGLVSKEGVEVLIHVGMDTVQLGGTHFEAFVQQEDTVKKGDKLLSFDIDAIQKAGYKTTTPVVVTNTSDYLDVIPAHSGKKDIGETIVTIVE